MGHRGRGRFAERRLLIEQLSRRDLLAADPYGTNDLQPLDVNRDSIVSALDAVRVINALNRAQRSSSAGGLAADPRESIGSFIDVNADGTGTALDALKVINALNRRTPIIAAKFPNDSAADGVKSFDLVTNDYAIDLVISVAKLGEERVFIRVNGSGNNPFQDITERFDDNRASLGRSQVDNLVGGLLPDGPHRFEVQVGSSKIDFAITVDTTSPELSVELAERSDTPPIGNNETEEPSVNLIGQTEPGALVELLETGKRARSDALGRFAFFNVPVSLGPNAFTFRATDSSGNATEFVRVITRVPADGFFPSAASNTAAPAPETLAEAERVQSIDRFLAEFGTEDVPVLEDGLMQYS